MRIIGGVWRGRRLPVAGRAALRPTPDRVRETLFNWLRAEIEGARCLDLFAGTGALGFEALSRGAGDVWLIERDPALAAALEAQAASLGAGPRAHVVHESAARFLAAPPVDLRFEVAFVDPPFAEPVESVLEALRGFAPARALVYVERRASDGLPAVPGAQWVKQGRAAAVAFGLLRFSGAA